MDARLINTAVMYDATLSQAGRGILSAAVIDSNVNILSLI